VGAAFRGSPHGDCPAAGAQGRNYDWVAIFHLASPQSQLKPTWFSFMEDEAVCPVATSPMTCKQECLQGAVPGQSHLSSLFFIQECCNQQVDSKLGRVGKPLGQEISK
jgi:hypothetical protein